MWDCTGAHWQLRNLRTAIIEARHYQPPLAQCAMKEKQKRKFMTKGSDTRKRKGARGGGIEEGERSTWRRTTAGWCHDTSAHPPSKSCCSLESTEGNGAPRVLPAAHFLSLAEPPPVLRTAGSSRWQDSRAAKLAGRSASCPAERSAGREGAPSRLRDGIIFAGWTAGKFCG